MTDDAKAAVDVVRASLVPGSPLTHEANRAAWTLAKAWVAALDPDPQPVEFVPRAVADRLADALKSMMDSLYDSPERRSEKLGIASAALGEYGRVTK